MSYKKGKDIKVPFDCLWHCYTRSFQSFYITNRVETVLPTSDQRFIVLGEDNTPEDFDKW